MRSRPAALLLRYSPAPADVAAIERLAVETAAAHPGGFERVDANRALDGSHLYLYFWSAEPVGADLAEAVAGRARALLPAQAPDVLGLVPVQDLPGASHGQAATHHYVVETDVAPEVAEDLSNWYGQEHLPGLAAVPGNVRARRLVAELPGGGQRSLACYDLTTPFIQQDPAWLAVRETDWSSRVRPHFKNTRRAMCERIFALEPGKGTL